MIISSSFQGEKPCAGDIHSWKGYTFPRQLTWPSTKKSDGTEKFAMTGSVDGCSVQTESQFVWTNMRMDTTQILWVMPERGPSLTSKRL